jgi:hypothetical protein
LCLSLSLWQGPLVILGVLLLGACMLIDFLPILSSIPLGFCFLATIQMLYSETKLYDGETVGLGWLLLCFRFVALFLSSVYC